MDIINNEGYVDTINDQGNTDTINDKGYMIIIDQIYAKFTVR